LDNIVPTEMKVPDQTYTALTWYTSYYTHTSGLKCTTIIIQELVPKGHIECTSAAISDQLFREMCSTDKKAVNYDSQEVNWYYEQAATYARRISAGNFDGKNAKYNPIFHLDSNDFSRELRANLIERLKTSIEAIHRVVEDAVFMIFRARHPMIFYQHIEAKGLRWEFV
jgi:hypothetical protein